MVLAILHITLLSLQQHTQLLMLLVCARFLVLHNATNLDSGPYLKKTCKLSFATSQAVSIALVAKFSLHETNYDMLSNVEWTLLVFDMLVLLVSYQTAHTTAETELVQQKKTISSLVQTQNFLITESDFHHQN